MQSLQFPWQSLQDDPLGLFRIAPRKKPSEILYRGGTRVKNSTSRVIHLFYPRSAYKRGERQRRLSSKPRDPTFGTSFRRTPDDGWWNGEENKAPNPSPPVPATSFSTFYFYRRGNQRDISPSSCASSPPSLLFILRRRSSSRWPPAISFTVTTRTSTSW